MAQADFTEFTTSLSSGSVSRGPTAGLGVPNGGGSFIYGMRSRSVVNGAVALFGNAVGFAPTAANKDHSVRGAIRKGVSSGATGFSCFLIACAQGADVTNNAYLLGVSDTDPNHIILAKRRIVDGIIDSAPGSSGVVRRSTQTFGINEWHHLRLDAVINTNGDVVLNVFRSDLVANAVTAPVWAAIPGMGQFIDDALGANTGSLPYADGRMGFGARFDDTGRVVGFDQIELIRET